MMSLFPQTWSDDFITFPKLSNDVIYEWCHQIPYLSDDVMDLESILFCGAVLRYPGNLHPSRHLATFLCLIVVGFRLTKKFTHIKNSQHYVMSSRQKGNSFVLSNTQHFGQVSREMRFSWINLISTAKKIRDWFHPRNKSRSCRGS